MLVYICTKFHENILDGIKVVGEVMVLFICTLSDGDLYLYIISFNENILDGIKVIEWTRFS